MNITIPKISVLMSVYNGSQYLHESVKSVLNQTSNNFEFIIIDDGSTDRSWEILKEFSRQDSRIVLIKNEENVGLTKSLNKGLQVAQGEYIARQDADDISLPTRFAQQVTYLDESKEAVLVSANYSYIDAQGSFINSLNLSDDPDVTGWYLLFYNRIGAHGLAMFRREAAIALGGYLESYRYSQDYEFWQRLRTLGKLKILPEILQLYRRSHSESISVKAKPEQEALSVKASQQAIEKLIFKQLSPAEVSDLKRFWLRKFSDIQSLARMNSNLALIFAEFVKTADQASSNHSSSAQDKDPIESQIKGLIADQFEAWIRNLSIRENFLKRAAVSSAAFFWAPLQVAKIWKGDLSRLFKKHTVAHE